MPRPRPAASRDRRATQLLQRRRVAAVAPTASPSIASCRQISLQADAWVSSAYCSLSPLPLALLDEFRWSLGDVPLVAQSLLHRPHPVFSRVGDEVWSGRSRSAPASIASARFELHLPPGARKVTRRRRRGPVGVRPSPRPRATPDQPGADSEHGPSFTPAPQARRNVERSRARLGGTWCSLRSACTLQTVSSRTLKPRARRPRRSRFRRASATRLGAGGSWSPRAVGKALDRAVGRSRVFPDRLGDERRDGVQKSPRSSGRPGQDRSLRR